MPPAILVVAGIAASAIAAKKAADAKKAAERNNSGATGNFAETPNYDKNRFEYGGRPGVAEEAAGRFGGAQETYRGHSMGFLDEARHERGLALESRGLQGDAANLMLNRARGHDLVSDRMAGVARTDLGARMHSAAASAQGPAALANAQSDAMAAEAQGLGQINTQASIAGMQEQQAAEQAAFGAASGMREGDMGMRGLSLQGAGQTGALGAQYGSLENQVRANQNALNSGQQQLLEGSKQNADKLNVGSYQAGKQRDTEGMKMAVGAGVGLAQAGAAASDPLAKSGIQQLGAPAGQSTGVPQQTSPQQQSFGAPSRRSNPMLEGPLAPLPEAVDIGVNTGVPQASDPQAKQEMLAIGYQAGQASVRQPVSFERMDPAKEASNATHAGAATMAAEHAKAIEAISPGLAGLISAGAGYNAAGSKLDARRAPDGTEPLSSGKRGPRSPDKAPSPPQSLEITQGKDRAGVPTRSTATQDMLLRPGPDFSMAHYAPEPPPTLASYDKPQIPQPSDPRAKDLGGVHDNEVAETLDLTPAVSYKYKDPSYEPDAQRPGERQAGFLTTDLKRTPLGAAVVEKRPDGLDGYNEHRLNGLQHAEIRNLHERLRDLEAFVAGGRHGR